MHPQKLSLGQAGWGKRASNGDLVYLQVAERSKGVGASWQRVQGAALDGKWVASAIKGEAA